ncbi:MAG: HEAT repeat domain-containing protein, partial [Simkania negevensis]|nr:HEAT repeat domain-containing protein [Simkania negevensis]
IQSYLAFKGKTGKHDFTILEEMGIILLRQGAKKGDESSQLLSMYGAKVGGVAEGIDIYELGISSQNPLTQMAAIGFLAETQDDRAVEILLKAFHTYFLEMHMEAAYALASKKSPMAIGVIHSLMEKLPPYFRVYFPELFAMIGTREAMAILSDLASDPQTHVRLAAFLAAAKYGRDDFLSSIRAAATHPEEGEQEVAAMALGYLRDSHSIPLLKKLSASPHSNVKLAAAHSLSLLGLHEYREVMIDLAQKKNPFAISLLASVPGSEPLLVALLRDYNMHVKFNAALSLLRRKDPRCLSLVEKILIRDESDLGFEPAFSSGHSLMTWKAILSATQQAKEKKVDIPSITLSLREQILQEALELPEEIFLELARKVFYANQKDLIPLLVRLLQNLQSEKAVALLKEQSERPGSPLVRNYCHLALYRMKEKGSHREVLYKWIEEQKSEALIRFRPLLPWTAREGAHYSYLLTPEETSRLLIEAFETLAESDDVSSIDLLLKVIAEGNEKNRYALAGLLLKATQ